MSKKLKVVENYLLQEVIGQGEYGEVYKAQHTHNKQNFAIKMLDFHRFSKSQTLQDQVINEVQSLKKLNHPNILQFHKLLKTSNNIYLVFEYCENGSLQDLLNQREFLPEQQAIEIFSQIIEGFQDIHNFNIVHQDIKPSNILFGKNNKVKIADFGFCKILSGTDQQSNSQSILGSPIYMSPEAMKGDSPSKEHDIYSLGSLLYEMLYGVCPFEESNFDDLYQKKVADVVKFPSQKMISEKTIKLLLSLLNLDKSARFDIKTIHEYLQKDQFNEAPPQQAEQNYHNIQQTIQETEKQFGQTQDQEIQGNFYEQQSIERQTLQKEFGFDQLQPQPQQKAVPQNPEFKKINIQLLKIRNKAVYISNIICAVLDLNLNSDSVYISYLLIRRMKDYIEDLSSILNTQQQQGSQSNFLQSNGVSFRTWNQYTETQEYQSFMDILNFEEQNIIQKQAEFEKLIIQEQKTQGNSFNFSQKYNPQLYRNHLRQYCEVVKNKAKQYIQENNIEYTKKFLIHANNVLDCADIDQFFQQFIKDNYKKIGDQPYFLLVGSIEQNMLLNLIEAKLK